MSGVHESCKHKMIFSENYAIVYCYLTNLDLEYCSELDDAGLSSFLNLCSDQLITLDVSGVYISEEFLANVQTSQPGLKIRIDSDLD